MRSADSKAHGGCYNYMSGIGVPSLRFLSSQTAGCITHFAYSAGVCAARCEYWIVPRLYLPCYLNTCCVEVNVDV